VATPESASGPLGRSVGLSAAEVFERLLETAPDAIVVVDSAGRILYVNGQTERLFGYTRAELLEESIERLVPQRLRARHSERRAEYGRAPRQRPMGLDMSLSAVRKDGTEFPVEISLSPVALDGTGLVSASIRDVSRLQSAREALARGRYQACVARLGEEVIGARRIEDVVDKVPAPVAGALGADVVMLYLPGPDRAELVCRAAHGVPAELASGLRIANDASTGPGFVAASGQTVSIDDYASERRFRPDPVVAALGLVSGLGVPILSEEGAIGVLCACSRVERVFSEDDRNFLHSVANIVSSAAKVLLAEERLRHSQRLEAVGQLTGGIAHDFNNLLTVILGNLQIVAEDLGTDAEAAKPVEAAMRAAGSAAELTRKLLAFSRRQPLRPRAIDANELVGGMLDMIRRTLGERITILAFPDPAVPPAHADPGQLETALINLVVNARDAMPGGGRLTIETGMRTLTPSRDGLPEDLVSGRYVMIAVSDNGAGMSPEVARRAFDPYFTTKERGKGSGLGLSMVHGFARQSGGHVSIESLPGQGTTVRIFLPAATEATRSERPRGFAALPAGTEVVLLVEDEDEVRQIGARFLRALGYRVLEAADAPGALALIDARPDIALLFTDIVLPGSLDGVELARIARDRRPGLRLLYASGYASGVTVGRDALDAPLLDKPYHRETLARAVRAALDG